MVKSLGAVATILLLATTHLATAAPMTYTLSGTVTQIGLTPTPGISVGEDIPISITVETPPGQTGPDYNGTPGLNDLFTSATFNGANALGLFQQVTITPGSSIVLTSFTPLTGFGFTVTLTGAMNGALSSNALPTALNPGDFSGGTFTVEEVDQIDESYSGTIDGIQATPVPEPASWLLLGAGFLGVGFETTRRRWRAPK